MKIEINKADLDGAKRMLVGLNGAMPRVISRSINKTTTSGKGYAAKEVVKHYNLTQTRVKKDMWREYASVARLQGALIAKGKPLSLTTFRNTRQTAKGVSVQIKKSNSRWVWRHAFIRTVKNAKQAFYRPLPKGVERSTRLSKRWKRSDKYGVLPRPYRYGIKGYLLRLTGPRIEDELSKDRTLRPVIKQIDERFKIVVNQELNFEFSKL